MFPRAEQNRHIERYRKQRKQILTLAITNTFEPPTSLIQTLILSFLELQDTREPSRSSCQAEHLPHILLERHRLAVTEIETTAIGASVTLTDTTEGTETVMEGPTDGVITMMIDMSDVEVVGMVIRQEQRHGVGAGAGVLNVRGRE
jgi:hypothetical protein